MTQKKNARDRRKLFTRIISLTLAGLMVFSVVLAAALNQIFDCKACTGGCGLSLRLLHTREEEWRYGETA